MTCNRLVIVEKNGMSQSYFPQQLVREKRDYCTEVETIGEQNDLSIY